MFNTRQLAAWLREARDAHHKWEDEYLKHQWNALESGAVVPALAQDHWPEWYAEWLLPKLTNPTESNNCPYEPVCPKGLTEGDPKL